ncbi:MAG: methylated-DNA--[protein]-cysteine S-methyltransferase [Caldimonas sp.]
MPAAAGYDAAIMDPIGHTLFDTAIGACAIAWNARGIVGLQLPESTPERTAARLRRRFPDTQPETPPPAARAAIDGIVALLDGEPIDLSGVVLDESGVPEFHRAVYAIARTIAPGSTLSYGEIATRLGDPAAARAVGQALGQNPFAPIVPCHRVLAAGGAIGGFSAGGGATTKRRMLAIEQARVGDAPDLFDATRAPLRSIAAS